MTKKIVIINQATNYLTIGLANAFSEKFDSVSIITGSIHSQGEELNPNIKITWISKWSEGSTKYKFILYIKACLGIYWILITKYRNHEVFFLSLPPMAYLLNLIVPNKFSMLIWDVYPDVLKITGMKEKNMFYRIWSKLNYLSFKKANKLYTIGNRMSELLQKYVNKEKIIISPIWSIFENNSNKGKLNNPFVTENILEGKFIVQYSGNIGLTHKVEIMIELANRLKDNNSILFQIIGRGIRVPFLKKIVEEKKLQNCVFLPFQSDKMFPYSLSAADLGIVILDSITSKGSVPSKSYNLMAFGIPSLYISSHDSELYDYSIKYDHAKCFDELELDKAVAFIVELSQNKNMHNQLSENALKAAYEFKRINADKIVEKYFN